MKEMCPITMHPRNKERNNEYILMKSNVPKITVEIISFRDCLPLIVVSFQSLSNKLNTHIKSIPSLWLIAFISLLHLMIWFFSISISLFFTLTKKLQLEARYGEMLCVLFNANWIDVCTQKLQAMLLHEEFVAVCWIWIKIVFDFM